MQFYGTTACRHCNGSSTRTFPAGKVEREGWGKRGQAELYLPLNFWMASHDKEFGGKQKKKMVDIDTATQQNYQVCFYPLIVLPLSCAPNITGAKSQEIKKAKGNEFILNL